MSRCPAQLSFPAPRTWGGRRAGRVFPAVRGALAAASHEGFRLVHFSTQNDHLHLLVEADTQERLSRGLPGLAIRVARAVNRALGRRGRVWGDRFHARALATPREVRHALVYVLMNVRKHMRGALGLDSCSSARWFTGWRDGSETAAAEPPPMVRPRTGLAAVGWRRHGLIGREERPRA